MDKDELFYELHKIGAVAVRRETTSDGKFDLTYWLMNGRISIVHTHIETGDTNVFYERGLLDNDVLFEQLKKFFLTGDMRVKHYDREESVFVENDSFSVDINMPKQYIDVTVKNHIRATKSFLRFHKEEIGRLISLLLDAKQEVDDMSNIKLEKHPLSQ